MAKLGIPKGGQSDVNDHKIQAPITIEVRDLDLIRILIANPEGAS